jgi:hypothetical protein
MLIIFSILLLLLIGIFPIAAVIVGARAERQMRKILEKERENKN